MEKWGDSADIVFKNAEVFSPFTCEWQEEDIAVRHGVVIGTGPGYRGKREVDLKNSPVVPGFIDAHVHIESSLLTPHEYARLVMQHGTTSVIADPHEIANVCGIAGIEYMLNANQEIPMDILVMLPSCVPATPFDESFMVLDAEKLQEFINREGIIGLGEMMNVPGVINRDPDVAQKLSLFSIRDGHAPFVNGIDLDQYITSGLQSDHETVLLDEGKEKLRKGMYLFIREGSTERNLKTLIPLVTPCSATRCSFCTDDRHTDMLVNDGHIDDCIRKSIKEGCEPELAYRMACLSPAERFGLNDRGGLSPGRIADFCVLEDVRDCRVKATYKRGGMAEYTKPHLTPPVSRSSPFRATVPSLGDIRISGSGTARVVRIQEGQIGTKAELLDISGDMIPDLDRDILKLVVVSRYMPGRTGIGLVRGMGLKKGAIASSISHDSHNIIATGTSDEEIIAAISSVVRHNGAMVARDGKREVCLPLSIAGLMSELPYEEVSQALSELHEMTDACSAINDPFMYLSFLALTVIPEIRVTSQGVFDGLAFTHVPLFIED